MKSTGNKILQKMTNWIKTRKNLRMIIGLAMTLVASLTLLLFVFMMIFFIRDTLISDLKTNAAQSVHLSYITLTNKHQDMIRKSSILADELQHAENDGESLMDRMTSAYRLNDEIVSLSLFSKEGKLKKYAPAHYRSKEEIELYEEEWFRIPRSRYSFAFSSPHLQQWFDTPQRWVISLIKEIEVEGTPYDLVIDYDFSAIRDYIDRVSIGKRGYSFILDEENRVLYHPNKNLFEADGSDQIMSLIETEGDGVYTTPDDQYVTAWQTVPQSRWKVVGVSYMKESLQPTFKEIGYFTLIVLILILVFVVILSLTVSKAIAHPIQSVVQSMKQRDTKVLKKSVKEKSFYEVEELSDSYNLLIDRVHDLMNQMQHEQTLLRKSEISMLQSQINPHFLYNTLDSILWMSERGNQEETSEMVAALGKLMRISLSKGETLIPLKKELEHTLNYLTIQKIRYKDQFSYHLQIDEQLMEEKVPKVTIQPFIENALYHGIERMADEGEIWIRAIAEKNCFMIEIEDDGAGMTNENLEKIRRFDSGSDGFGIRNVQERISLMFGQEYGVTVHSELDEGTKIVIRLPKNNLK